MPKTLVRHALSTDFPTLLHIDKLSFPRGIAYDSAELSFFMQRRGAETLVAEVDAQIAGFLLMEIHRRSRSATIVTLDVLEKYRRQGVASELMQKSEEVLRARRILRYELQVDVANSGAIAFYTRHGFAVSEQLENYYSNGNDAYLMAKQLDAPV